MTAPQETSRTVNYGAQPRVNLVDAIWQTIPRLSQQATAITRIGVVNATSPLTVLIVNTSMACARLASYTPSNGDVVLVLNSGAYWVVLGKIVP